MFPEMLIPIAGAAASAGAAWGAVKVSLNGTRTRVRETQASVEGIREAFHRHCTDEHADFITQSDRLARVETKIDLLLLDKTLR